MSLDQFFASMPDETEVTFINNERHFGFHFTWSEKGHGFGEYWLGVNKETGMPEFDNEEDGPNTVCRVMARSVGKVIHSLEDE